LRRPQNRCPTAAGLCIIASVVGFQEIAGAPKIISGVAMTAKVMAKTPLSVTFVTLSD
jgi:hypothetical protein